MDMQALLHRELQCSFEFFLDYTNLDPNSAGYGLSIDATKNPGEASIAATGFALSGWVIGVERGYIPRQRALEITRRTLRTLWERVPHHRGFFAHFLDMHTAERLRKCEYSTIDTALALNGVITAAAYFDDAEVRDLAQQLLERVDWRFIIFEVDGQTRFRMAYNPDHDGDYVQGKPGYLGQWDMAAEQKMMYLQAAGHIEADTARRLYHGFRRDTRQWQGHDIIVNPGGTLFAYQFSEAWLDTARYLDPDGLDWFENTRLATLANRAYCLQHAKDFATYGENSWGASAGDAPWGYDVSGATPCLDDPKPNGIVSIYSAISSLPYTPDVVLAMIEHLYNHHPQTWGKYGFFDAYNLAHQPVWYSDALYGIDKGCSMVMIENYLSGLIWQTYSESPYIQKALAILGFHERSKTSG